MPPRLQKVPATDAGQRLDRWLKRICSGVPFIGLQKAIRTGGVKVNGRKVPPDYRLKANDAVQLPAMPEAPASAPTKAYTATTAELKQLRSWVILEDTKLLVLNKPQGLAAQAGGGITKSLDRLLVAAYGADKAPKLVHRLDKETSGLMVCAKNRTTAATLGAQWAGRGVTKAYLALVMAENLPAKGEFKEALIKVGPIAKVTEQITETTRAHTSWMRLGQVQPGVWAVLAYPRTGRMNQIRAHFAHHNAPLVGDDKYGPFAQTKTLGKSLGTGLALHAWRLKLIHPQNNQPIVLEAPLPPNLATMLTNTALLLEQAHQAWQRWVQEKE